MSATTLIQTVIGNSCMKNLISILAFVISLSSFGQLPEYSSNVIDLDITSSTIYHEFRSDYPTIISFGLQSFWNDRESFKILAFNGNNWKLIEWSYKPINWEKPKIKKERKVIRDISEDRASNLINLIIEEDLLSYSNDSLNWNQKTGEDGWELSQEIMDGTTHEFQIISSGFVILRAYEPEQLQTFVENEQRKKFLQFEHEFLKLFNN